MLEHFKFSIGGFFGGYHQVESNRQDDGTYRGVYKAPFAGRLDGVQDREFALDENKAEELDGFLSAELQDWQESYFAPVLDGTQWNLEHNEKHYGGSNAYPDNFDLVLKWIVEKLGLYEFEGEIDDGN